MEISKYRVETRLIAPNASLDSPIGRNHSNLYACKTTDPNPLPYNLASNYNPASNSFNRFTNAVGFSNCCIKRLSNSRVPLAAAKEKAPK